MKKGIGAVVLVLVLITAVSAFAHGGWSGRRMARFGMMGDGCAFSGAGMARGTGGRGMMGGFACEEYPRASVGIPQEIRDKQLEMDKLRIDMQNEISRKPIDRNKIEAIQKKHSELREELSTWFLKQRLDAIEKLQK